MGRLRKEEEGTVTPVSSLPAPLFSPSRCSSQSVVVVFFVFSFFPILLPRRRIPSVGVVYVHAHTRTYTYTSDGSSSDPDDRSLLFIAHTHNSFRSPLFFPHNLLVATDRRRVLIFFHFFIFLFFDDDDLNFFWTR